MSQYRIVRGNRKTEIHDQYGRCVDVVLDPGAWRGVPEPQPAASDVHLVDLIERGESTGAYEPQEFQEQRVYDSTTGRWSTRAWPTRDA